MAPALFLLFLALPAAGWRSELLKDLRTAPWPANGAPEGLTAVGSEAFFSTGSERGLWRSDGTVAGTEKLGPLRNPYRLGQAGGRHLFADAGLVGDYELWSTGDTPASTERLASGLQWIDVEQPAVEIGARSLIAVADEAHGFEPWVSDGTPAGTKRLADLVPGPGSSNPNGFVAWRGRVYFVTSSAAGASLWATNGERAFPIAATPAPVSGPSRAYGLRALPGGLVFFTEGRGRGAEVWRSDGTARGTFRLARLTRRPVPDGGFVLDLLAIGDRLTFLLHLVEASGDDRNELWSTDGSSAGTVRLLAQAGLTRGDLGTAKRRLVYSSDRDHGTELWGSDGTAAGTRIVADLCPGPCSTYIDAIVWIGERIAVVARNPPAGNSATLWSIDPEVPEHRPIELANFANFRSANALGAGAQRGTFTIDLLQKSWLWSTDGSRAGTHRLIEAPLQGFTGPGATLADGTLLFQGQDAEHGAELWRSDGTLEGTELVIDLATEDYGGSTPEYFAGDGGLGAFIAQDDSDRGLFVTDGTAAGTVRILLGRGPLFGPFATRSLGSKLCFSIIHGSRASLWVTDGSRAGTRDLLPAGTSFASAAEDLVRFGGEVYFAARDPEHGIELWASNGTRAGTRRVTDLAPGPANAAPRGLVLAAGRLWLTADGPDGRALYATDGSTEGTREIPGPRPTESGGGAERGGRFWYLAEGSEEQSLILASADLEGGAKESDLGHSAAFEAGPWRRVDDNLFLPFAGFVGGQVTQGLWVIDDLGTRFLSAPVLTGDPTAPTFAFAGRLFFAGNDASWYGRLWSSDGTPEGTGPFLDREGGSIAAPVGAGLLGGRAVFAGDAEDNGGAFWETDGTPEGTSKIAGALPVHEEIVWPIPARLRHWAQVGDRILYVSWDPEHGTEPWALSPDGGNR
jgi:ELWxxDGT repeat protein